MMGVTGSILKWLRIDLRRFEVKKDMSGTGVGLRINLLVKAIIKEHPYIDFSKCFHTVSFSFKTEREETVSLITNLEICENPFLCKVEEQ